MRLNLKARGIALSVALEGSVRQRIAQSLGRLYKQVALADVTIVERAPTLAGLTHICTVRLEVPGARDVLVQQHRKTAEAAVAGAVQKAGRELRRRGRWLGRSLPGMSVQAPVLQSS